jgi:hypothetical protein
LKAQVIPKAGGYNIILTLKSPDGCKGKFQNEVLSRPEGESLDFGASAPGKAWCEINLTRDGELVTIEETDTCQVFRKEGCSFNGSIARIK